MSKTNANVTDLNVQDVTATADVQDVQTKKADSLYDLVEIQLFKDNRRYKDDMKVLIGGHTWLIKRGVPVQVPRYVANVIHRSQKQDQASDAMVTKLVERYEERTRTETQA